MFKSTDDSQKLLSELQSGIMCSRDLRNTRLLPSNDNKKNTLGFNAEIPTVTCAVLWRCLK